MKIGHIYKKGKSYYLCQGRGYYTSVLTLKTGFGGYKSINLKTLKRHDIAKEDVKHYTHIGKAIDLIKRGIK